MRKKRTSLYVFIVCLSIFLAGIFVVLAENTGLLDLLISSNMKLKIDSPLEITYNFAIGSNYTLDLNVSSNMPVDSWWYDLVDLRHNQMVYSHVLFSPNTTFNAVRWENQLIVYANNSGGSVFDSTVLFNVFVNNSAPIIGKVNSPIYVCEGNSLY
ncbi:MAG: hypothetical protein WCP89_02945, partial [archaeon]